MLDDNKPNGFVRLLSEFGWINEGIWKNGDRNGFGREILSNGSYVVGFWKDGCLHGNCRKYNKDGTIKEEGLYNYNKHFGEFKNDKKEQ